LAARTGRLYCRELMPALLSAEKKYGVPTAGIRYLGEKAAEPGVAAYRGRRITTEESDRREAGGARYMFALNKRWVIDGSPRWNVARYINHSCRPNAKPVGRSGAIVIVAVIFWPHAKTVLGVTR